jgi:restriction system protein
MMARRRKESGADVLLELVSMLPWWAGLLLAVVAYVGLHSLATPPQPAPMQPGQLGAFVGKEMVSSLAALGQYLLPLICVVAAGVSFWKQRERSNLVTTVAHSKSADALDGMSWQDFEKLVCEAFRQQGYSVAETGGGGADGGIDLVLGKYNEKFLVQCKQWKAFKVGVDVVRALYGVMAAKGATGGFVVTSGEFTDEAKAFASGRNVDLIDGQRLFAMIQRARQSSSLNVAALRSTASTAASSTDPVCPICGSEMIKRTAKKGANAGSQFWGCIKYPACRGTRTL